MKLQIWERIFEIELNSSILAQKIFNHLPLQLEVNGRYWDEIYTLTDFGFPLDENAKEIMEVGDIAYWVKSDGSKEAIAIFFWNTPAGDGTKPIPVSKCSVIWKIVSEIVDHEIIGKWDKIILW